VAHERLKNKIAYTNIAQGILPKLFTLTQLQNVYEIIWKKNIDKRNFRKKILKLNILEETNQKESGVSYRPAKLYKFKDENIKEIDIF
jgi:8-oxo-dGTP diphosphatase